MSEENPTPYKERKKNKILWSSIGAVALIIVCAGIFMLYHYATYDSICFDLTTRPVPYYFLRAVYPDLETTEVLLKDKLMDAFSQELLAPGYPTAEVSTEAWRSPIIDDLPPALNSELEGRGIFLKEYRTKFFIHLSDNVELSISYHRPKTDQDSRVILGEQIFIFSFLDTIPSLSSQQLSSLAVINIRFGKTIPLSDEEISHIYDVVEKTIIG